MTKRPCTKCKIVKPLSDFSPHARGPYGRQTCCKACNNERNKARYSANLVASREASRLRALKDQAEKPEQRRASRRAWVARNPEKDRQAKREYELRNRDSVLAWKRAYAKANQEQWTTYARHGRARKFGAPGTHTKADIEAMLCAQSGRCNVCRKELRKYDVDHIVPLTRGGSNDVTNLQILCPSCNRTKSNKHPSEFSAGAECR